MTSKSRLTTSPDSTTATPVEQLYTGPLAPAAPAGVDQRASRRNVPGKTKIAVDLTDELLAHVRRAAEELDCSDSNVIEFLVIQGMLNTNIEKLIDLREVYPRFLRHEFYLPTRRLERARRCFWRRKPFAGRRGSKRTQRPVAAKR